MRDLAQQAVLEEHQTKCAPGHGDAGGLRLQLIPKEQTANGRCRPGVHVMDVALAPFVGHTNEACERVEDDRDDGQRQEPHADAVPGGGDVEIYADAAEQRQSGESVRLPRQFFELEALVDNCKDQRKRGPLGGQPAVGSFVPPEEGQEPGRRERMKEGDDAGIALLRRGFLREEVQARGNEGNGEDAQGNGAPELLLEFVVVEESADKSAETDDVGLPGKLLVTNPARGEREHDGENDPANGNPGRAKRLLKDPDHDAGAGPSVGHARKLEMPFIRCAQPLGEPIAANNDRQCAERAHRNGVPEADGAWISGERGEYGEAGEKMGVPGKGVITQRARGLGQSHRENHESEGLPKLRRFEPNEKSKETAARGGEETANGALPRIVAQCSQPGGEIERCTKKGKS